MGIRRRDELIDVKLAADSGKARMTLEHTAIIEDHWNQFGPGAVGIGWDLALTGLALHLATGASVDHETAEAWMGSPDGKEFMTERRVLACGACRERS